ncbi:hypothetical protein BS17DRAFT_488813 [Gyrodon lividus]|nr:hypothetical protein BS17DRAFT_488813 [Gyrodon lividus]
MSGNVPPFGSAPSTPNLRNRASNFTENVTPSPTSTTMSESGVSFLPTNDSSQIMDSRVHTSAGFLSSRKITIRSDPALLTCFDPADKQLYDLWVPRN